MNAHLQRESANDVRGRTLSRALQPERNANPGAKRAPIDGINLSKTSVKLLFLNHFRAVRSAKLVRWKPLVKHSRCDMFLFVGLSLLLRLAVGTGGFHLLVLLALWFFLSVHTGNTSFILTDIIMANRCQIFFICLIDFFYRTARTPFWTPG